MTYRLHIAVLLATPEEWRRDEKDFLNMAAYTFGINATDTVSATNLAMHAAKNAVDRNGEFIGGIVIETNCRQVDRKEFNGYEKYLLQPLSEPGIFYVSGVTSTRVAKDGLTEALIELEKMRATIKLNGLPTSSFVHPPLPTEPLKNVRLLCSTCGHWIEIEGLDVIFSFMGGLEMFSKEQREVWKGHSAAGPFVKRHFFNCFPRSIAAIHEDDARWDKLLETNRENENMYKTE